MKIKFVPEDCWIGLYFKRQVIWREKVTSTTTYYLCVIPCFPIIWEKRREFDNVTAAKLYHSRVDGRWNSATVSHTLPAERIHSQQE